MSYSKEFDEKTLYQPKRLVAFDLRIGGHTTILVEDENTICKLAKFNEKHFYDTLDELPKELLEYIPEYKGSTKVVEVETEQKEKIYISRVKSSDSRLRNFDGPVTENNKNSVNKDDVSNKKYFNNEAYLRQLSESTHDKGAIYVKLENLVAKYKHPCILDIKMGRRQHGDDQDEEAIKKLIEQCKKTTQYEIGAKIHGMQVYKVDSGNSKKFGRERGNQLSGDEFYNNLKEFFNNGIEYRIELLEPIIEKLKNLEKIIKKMNKYRFYDSSILISYDGENKYNLYCYDPKKLVSVNLIDFSHVKLDEKAEDTPDDGYLFGLRNIIDRFTKVENELKYSK